MLIPQRIRKTKGARLVPPHAMPPTHRGRFLAMSAGYGERGGATSNGGRVIDKIALKISPANLRGVSADDEVGKRLLQAFAHADYYHLEPPKGGHFGAAIDWIIIAQIADVLGIASALWLVYDEIIRPLKRSKDDEQGLYVAIDPQRGLQWFLGKDFKDREVFIRDFVAKVTEYQRTDDAGHVLTETVREIQASEMWVKK